MSLADSGYLAGAEFRADCVEIVRALDAAQATRSFEGGAARDAVTRCATSARAAGVMPEKLIIALKTLMREVALPEMRSWYRGVLTDRVIVWAIEAFYGIAEPARDGASATGGSR